MLLLKCYLPRRYYAGWADKLTGLTIPTNGPYFGCAPLSRLVLQQRFISSQLDCRKCAQAAIRHPGTRSMSRWA